MVGESSRYPSRPAAPNLSTRGSNMPTVDLSRRTLLFARIKCSAIGTRMKEKEKYNTPSRISDANPAWHRPEPEQAPEPLWRRRMRDLSSQHSIGARCSYVLPYQRRSTWSCRSPCCVIAKHVRKAFSTCVLSIVISQGSTVNSQ